MFKGSSHAAALTLRPAAPSIARLALQPRAPGPNIPVPSPRAEPLVVTRCEFATAWDTVPWARQLPPLGCRRVSPVLARAHDSRHAKQPEADSGTLWNPCRHHKTTSCICRTTNFITAVVVTAVKTQGPLCSLFVTGKRRVPVALDRPALQVEHGAARSSSAI